MDNKKIAVMFKAFCDENRLQILGLLRSGERCACDILEEMHITQPTLSHHMKILCDAGDVWSILSTAPSMKVGSRVEKSDW